MPKWAKDTTEFPSPVFDRGKHGISIQLPKPVFEKLGNPSKVKFVVKGKRIEIVAVQE